MEPIDEITMLDSMIVLVDTREQMNERAAKRYKGFGIPYKRAHLNYGDYTYNAQLPDGRWLFEEGQVVSAPIAIERKMNLDELAQCFTKGRDRFEREFKRAKTNNARIFVLIENGSWEHLLAGRYQSRFNQKAFLASLCAWIVRYDLQLIFCKEESSGKIIKEFLYRDLKERISRGEYDTGGNQADEQGAAVGEDNSQPCFGGKK